MEVWLKDFRWPNDFHENYPWFRWHLFTPPTPTAATVKPKAEMHPKRPNQWIHTWSSTCQHCLHSPPTPTSFRRVFFPTEFGITDHFPPPFVEFFEQKKSLPAATQKKFPVPPPSGKKNQSKSQVDGPFPKFPPGKALVSEDACFFYINVAKPGWLLW